MSWKATIVACAAVILGATTAKAATVTTPAITGIEDGGFSCHVVNVSGARQRIKILIPGIVDENEFIEVLPGLVTGTSIFSGQGQVAYCRVITQGNSASLRVSFEARTQLFPRGQTIAVVEGR